jgi:hypothetical protein
MRNSFAEHPSNDLLERYSLTRLADRDLAYVEEHLLICEWCRQRLSETEAFISATRAATRELREAPLDFTHYTGGGPIRLLAEITEAGDWKATISGQQIEATPRFATVAEANEHLMTMFRQLFPEHECSERCG